MCSEIISLSFQHNNFLLWKLLQKGPHGSLDKQQGVPPWENQGQKMTTELYFASSLWLKKLMEKILSNSKNLINSDVQYEF